MVLSQLASRCSCRKPVTSFVAFALLAAWFLDPHSVDAATSAEPNAAKHWNSAALQGIRDAKLGAPVVARALAIDDTCMYDAWAAYDEHSQPDSGTGRAVRPESLAAS